MRERARASRARSSASTCRELLTASAPPSVRSSEALGERLANSLLTAYDDGTMPGEWETQRSVAGSIGEMVRFGLPDDPASSSAASADKKKEDGKGG